MNKKDQPNTFWKDRLLELKNSFPQPIATTSIKQKHSKVKKKTINGPKSEKKRKDKAQKRGNVKTKMVIAKSITEEVRFSNIVTLKNTQQKSIEVDWQDVLFDDFMIRVKYSPHFSGPFHVSESRKSFKLLKNYILSLRLNPLKIHLKGNEIIAIENINQLHNVVRILSIKSELIDNYRKEVTTNIRSVLDSIMGINTEFLIKLAKAKNEDICVDHLARLQDRSFKPVPVFEIIPTGNTFNTEDTFIFTITRKNRIFLIWESTVNGRASYIFTSKENDYEDILQSIYDYISSYQRTKRMKLRTKDNSASDLNYVTFITHNSFEKWKIKLNSIINEE